MEWPIEGAITAFNVTIHGYISALMIKKPDKTIPSVWTFFKPFPVHLWFGIIAAFVATSFAMFIVHHMGTLTRKMKSKSMKRVKEVPDYAFQSSEPSETHGQVYNDIETRNKILGKGQNSLGPEPQTSGTKFTFLNCMWFTVAAFMQQGSSLEPR